MKQWLKNNWKHLLTLGLTKLIEWLTAKPNK